MEAEGKPFSHSTHCYQPFSDDCATLKVKAYKTKPTKIADMLQGYRGFSGSFRFKSGEKYAAEVENSRDGQLNTYAQFQFKFRFHYQRAQRTLYEYVNITRFIVTYHNCPKIVFNLAVYTNVPAAREVSRKVESTGTCIENAEPLNVRGKLLRFCDSNAKAEFFGHCVCSKGFQEENKMCVGKCC